MIFKKFKTYKIKSYKTKMLISLILMSIFILIIIVGVNYYINKNNLIKSYEEIRQSAINQTEMALNLIDVSYTIMNESMDYHMKKISKKLHNEYKAVNRNISQLSLKDLRDQYGVSDIYLINDHGIVERTTFRPDLNLNLYNLNDSFKNFLVNVRKRGKYVSPPMTIEHNTKLLKKYSYYPTYDKKYIIELGWYDNDFNKTITKADFNSLIQDIKNQNEIIRELRILTDDYIVIGDSEYKLPAGHTEMLKDRLNQDNIVSITDDSQKITYTYKLIDMNSMTEKRIAQIVFTAKPMLKEMHRIIRLNLFLILWGIVITVIVSYFFSQKIINPDKLKKMNKKLLLINERKKMAGEIHDTLGHILTTAIVQLEVGRKLIKNKNIDLALDKFKLAENEIRNGLDDTRDIVKLLKEDREKLDLIASIKSLIENTEEFADVVVKYEIEEITKLNVLQEEIIYRALKEGLTNGIRHGEASSFIFKLKEKENKVNFLLKDNGQGCEELIKGFGLTTIKDRVRGQGGDLKIDSKKDIGFTLKIEMPIEGDIYEKNKSFNSG